MICIHSMADSLLLTQFLRLMKSSYTKSILHISFWLGDFLEEFTPGAGLGSLCQIVPDYYAYIESLLVLGQIDDLVSTASWRMLTNRKVYLKKIELFPTPKVEIKAGISYSNVWRLVNLPVLSSSTRDILYLLIHNKLPIRERMFRVGSINDPYCLFCEDAPVCDLEHYFCFCKTVQNLWSEVRHSLILLVGSDTPNSSLLNLTFPPCTAEKEIVWLVGHYVEKVWISLFKTGSSLIKKEEFFGYLRFKFKADQLGARHRMSHIPGLM